MGPAHGRQLWKVSTDAKFLIILPETRCVSELKKNFFSFKINSVKPSVGIVHHMKFNF